MDYLTIITTAVGGLGLFLYGMHVLADGLQRLAGGKMKQLLELLTRNRFLGVLVGAGVTGIIQSSSATTVMVVGFVNAHMMDLSQAVGVIMGANIGTTVTAWLVSSVEWASVLKPDFFAPVLMCVGACLVLFTKTAKLKDGGAIAAGFGMLFIGMNMMSAGLRPLADNEAFRQLFVSMGVNPLLGLLAGVLVTGVIQSSSASVGILQSLAIVGLVPWNSAVYIIMGQNIGTCVTAILSSLGAQRNAKAAAYTHLMFNVIGSVIFTPLAIIFFKFFDTGLGGRLITATEIGIVHTSFNVACTAILFGFADKLVWLASRMARFTPEQEKTTEAAYLDERVLNSPALAIKSAVREIARLAHMALDNLNAAARAVMERDKASIDELKANEKSIDRLTDEIKKYLVAILSGGTTSKADAALVTRLTNICERVERVGDHAENIFEAAEYLIDSETRFSKTAGDELGRMFKATSDCFEKALTAFERGDKAQAAEARRLEDEVDNMKEAFRETHVERLAAGSCAIGADTAFLDLLTDMERITDHANNMAKFVLGKVNHAKAGHGDR